MLLHSPHMRRILTTTRLMFGRKKKSSLPSQSENLWSARCGQPLKVVGVRAGSESAMRLLELGFCRSAEVCKLSEGQACLCVLRGMRIALGRELASDVLVQRLDA